MDEILEEVNGEYTAHEIVAVSMNGDGTYGVRVSGAASVEEVAFCMCVVLKCFERDGIIDRTAMLALVNKYLTDPQYDEVQQDDFEEVIEDEVQS